MSHRVTIPTEDAAPLTPRMTFEEFLAWSDEDTFAEWVDGEVQFLTTSNEHQMMVGFLVKLLLSFVETRDLGLVLFAPFLMKTGPNLPGREPDILFVACANLSRVKENYLDGPADLTVEVVSPESRTRDREAKFREYASGGVPEYWLIDPPRRQAEFYRLNPIMSGYEPLPIGPDGVIRSGVLPGFWMAVDWLWERPFPTLAAVQQQWDAPIPQQADPGT